MTDRATNRDLAELGVELGDDDGRLWKLVLRASASARRYDFGGEKFIEFVSGQAYGEIVRRDPDRVAEYVETFLDVYELEDRADVDRLLGREAFERRNYEGQLAFAKA